MAHFAQIDNSNVVTQVIVVGNDQITTHSVEVVDGQVQVSTTELESLGIEYLQGLFGADTTWVQTSYHGSFRGKYAGIGDTYDGNVFVTPSVE